MILIADSGSTKTDWCVVDEHQVIKKIKTKGINPFFQTEDEIAKEIHASLIPQLPETAISNVYFYGAGCTAEKTYILENGLRKYLQITDTCEVATDMLAAARSLCGHKAGIACILGTGSNSCAYDGESITKNVSPLGFILGDEGSGAVLGKTLIGDVLKNQLPEPIIHRFDQEFHLSGAEIIDRVYRKTFPNRFLAGFVPFLKENLEVPAISQLVEDQFKSFLVRNVELYEGWNRLPIGFNGSIAYYFQAPLKRALEKEGMTLGHIIQAPMEGLIAFHTGKI